MIQTFIAKKIVSTSTSKIEVIWDKPNSFFVEKILQRGELDSAKWDEIENFYDKHPQVDPERLTHLVLDVLDWPIVEGGEIYQRALAIITGRGDIKDRVEELVVFLKDIKKTPEYQEYEQAYLAYALGWPDLSEHDYRDVKTLRNPYLDVESFVEEGRSNDPQIALAIQQVLEEVIALLTPDFQIPERVTILLYGQNLLGISEPDVNTRRAEIRITDRPIGWSNTPFGPKPVFHDPKGNEAALVHEFGHIIFDRNILGRSKLVASLFNTRTKLETSRDGRSTEYKKLSSREKTLTKLYEQRIVPYNELFADMLACAYLKSGSAISQSPVIHGECGRDYTQDYSFTEWGGTESHILLTPMGAYVWKRLARTSNARERCHILAQLFEAMIDDLNKQKVSRSRKGWDERSPAQKNLSLQKSFDRLTSKI